MVNFRGTPSPGGIFSRWYLITRFASPRRCAAFLLPLICAVLLRAQAIDPTFVSAATGGRCIFLQPDGKVLVGGSFTSGSDTKGNIVRLNVDGSLDRSFVAPTFDYRTLAVTMSTDGKIFVSSTINGAGPVRLNADGSIDPSFQGRYDGILALAPQPGGRILIGGSLRIGNTYAATTLMRLNPDGTTDPSFNAQVPGGAYYEGVRSFVVRGDGKIYVVGPFNFLSGLARNNCALVATDGSLDTSFAPRNSFGMAYATSDIPREIIPLADGRVIFTNLNGSLSCFTASGAVSSLFSATQPNYTMGDVLPLPSGKFLLGGLFDTLGTLPRNSYPSIARLNADGSVDPSYRIAVPDAIVKFLQQPDGKVLALGFGGSVTRIYEGQIVTSPLLGSATNGAAFSYTIKATNSPTAFAVAGLPPGLTFNSTTGVISGVPTQAGAFTVSLQAGGATGSVSGTLQLTVAKRAQTLAFTPVTTSTVGSPITLSAAASSGLPVTFVLVSGNATLSGSTLTLKDNAPVIVRAVQAGDGNVEAVSADQTIAATVRLQTIAPPVVGTKVNTDAPFQVSLSSSSALPVTLEVVSGPATVVGNVVTLTGAAGTVTLRATQSGNSQFLPATPVTVSFAVQAVTPLVYLGGVGADGKAGDFAVYYLADRRRGTLLGRLLATGEVFAVDFATDAGGAFAVTGATAGKPTGTNRLFRGTIDGNVFSGAIDGIVMNGAVASPAGVTNRQTGYYRAEALAPDAGTVSVIVAADGRIYGIAATAAMMGGGGGAVGSDGRFQISLGGAGAIVGSVDGASGVVAGTMTSASQAAQRFSGLASSVSLSRRLANLSTRGLSGQDENVLIVGFVVAGAAPKPLLLRAIGPALTSFGVAGALANPRLKLFRGSDLIAENNGWGTILSLTELQNATTRVGAFALTPGSKDSALAVTLDPGTYSVQASDPNAAGVALTEIYDAGASTAGDTARLVNLSTRGPVGADEQALIGGFVITGNAPRRLLVRAVGGGLVRFGITGAVANPRLRVYQNSAVLVENDDWDGGGDGGQLVQATSTAVGAFPLERGSKDSALVATLAPGAYSVIVSANGVPPGVGLLEIYEIPD
ncbi:MAG: putative Ig domain-containing protein [Verrucomicrobia bacterium]|nr:putative Ig domain-containing protein [Verrucomicrobiota bacterium]